MARITCPDCDWDIPDAGPRDGRLYCPECGTRTEVDSSPSDLSDAETRTDKL